MQTVAMLVLGFLLAGEPQVMRLHSTYESCRTDMQTAIAVLRNFNATEIQAVCLVESR